MGDTALLVVTNDAMTAAAVTQWIADQRPDQPVREVGGFYAAVAELRRGSTIVVADVGDVSGRDGWRVAELRAHAPAATAVVACDASMAPHLSGALRAELTVSRVHDLPPLRE